MALSGDAAVEATAPATAVLVGEPLVVQEVPVMPGFADRFTFWGWSADGRYYAYETYKPGEGAVECDMRYELFVVDADNDAFVPEGEVAVTHESPEPDASGRCRPVDLLPVIEAKRTALLEKHGIVSGNLSPAVPIEGAPGRTTLATPRGGKVPLVFRVLNAPAEPLGPEAEQGAAFYLALKHEGGSWVIEPGRRRRPYVLGYEPRFVLFSPDGRHAAFVVARTHTAFEGTRTGWMTSGVALPDYM